MKIVIAKEKIMRLFLASQMKHPKSVVRLKDFLGRDYQNKNVVYIPTASNGQKWGAWKLGESIKVAKSLWKSLKVVELEAFSREDTLEEVIGKPDILWMAGGVPGYLLYWIIRRGLDQYLKELLSSGTTYVGTSAGSMVCAPSVRLAELVPGENERGAGLFPGLSFINFEICPHYDESKYETIRKFWGKSKLLLLKDGDILTVVEGRKVVLGEETYLN